MAEERTFQFANRARSTLAAAVSSSATVLRVQDEDADKFPDLTYEDDIFAAVIWDTNLNNFEVVYCTAVNSNELTIERGKEGTSPRAFTAGAVIVHTLTRGLIDQITAPPPPETVLLAHFDEVALSGAESFFEDSSGSTNEHPVGKDVESNFDDSIARFGGGSLRADGELGNESPLQTDDGASSEDFAFGLGDYTIELFFRLDDADSSTEQHLLAFQEFFPTPRQHYITVVESTGRIRYHTNDDEVRISADDAFSNLTWHHLAISANSSGGVRTVHMYLDGVQVGDSYVNTSEDFSDSLWVTVGGSGSVAFPGNLDELRIIKGEGVYPEPFTPPDGPF